MSILYEYWDETLYFHHTVDQNPQNVNFGMHVHDEYELLYLISGQAVSLIESSEYTLTPGNLVIVRPMELHKIKIVGDDPYERISMHISKQLIQYVDPDGLLLRPFDERLLGQDNIYTVEDFSGSNPEKLFKKMCVKDDEKAKRLNILINLYPLLGEIRRIFLKKRTEGFLIPESGITRDIIDYINSHLYEDLSLELLSRVFFISVSQLNRVFKQATSSTVWEYILLKRLTSARNLIKNGCTAMEASHICGFKDYSAFYRAYVKKFGISPSHDKVTGSVTVAL